VAFIFEGRRLPKSSKPFFLNDRLRSTIMSRSFTTVVARTQQQFRQSPG